MARKESKSGLRSSIGSDHAALRARLIEQLANSLSAPLPKATERRVFGNITFPGKATAVVGMRRAGKTTFLHQIRRSRLETGIPQERLPHINFEDERLAGLATNDLSTLIEEYYRRFPALRGKEKVTWCFDEIQVVPGWERFVRRLLDCIEPVCTAHDLAGIAAGGLGRPVLGRPSAPAGDAGRGGTGEGAAVQFRGSLLAESQGATAVRRDVGGPDRGV